MEFRYFEWDERYNPNKLKSSFDTLWDLFQQLITTASGNVNQALNWLSELDKQFKITDQFAKNYGLDTFINELKERGYVENNNDNTDIIITKKTEQSLRKKCLQEIFKSLNKGGNGTHKTQHTGRGQERQPETKKWNKIYDLGQIDTVKTILNMFHHSSLDNFNLQEEDLEIYETDHYTSVATVLLIDLSHSMILYGEDRITPAKKVAMALSELIMNNYAKDSLDIVAFGNEAWQISVQDLPYLKAGPYHTNTKQGLEVARHILERKKNTNKQIFMITDGKPSCMIENGKFYKNSFGLDRKIINKVLDEAVKCRREKITITTFMIASDSYLQSFVREMTQVNNGKAYFASLNNLGGYIFEDYIRNRKKNIQ